MSAVKRYSIIVSIDTKDGSAVGGHFHHENGEWVQYEDYSRLTAALLEKQIHLDEIGIALDHVRDVARGSAK